MVVSSRSESYIRLQHSKFVQELYAMFFAAIGCTPLKINMELMEPKNEGLEDDFPLQKAVFQVRHLII